MKTKQITLKGWANSTNFLTSENVQNNVFLENYKKKETELISNGYKKRYSFGTLHGIKHSEKIIIKGWFWNGNWNDPTKETISIFYK